MRIFIIIIIYKLTRQLATAEAIRQELDSTRFNAVPLDNQIPNEPINQSINRSADIPLHLRLGEMLLTQHPGLSFRIWSL